MNLQPTCSAATARKLSRSFELENRRYGLHDHGTAQLSLEENITLGAGSYRRTPCEVLTEERAFID